MGLPDRAEDLIDEVDVPFSYAIVLFTDYSGGEPDADDAETYAESIDDPEYPVTSSEDQGILDAVPYSGAPLPGKCLLSPRMDILGCDHGHGEDEWAYDLIEEHEAR